MLSLFRLRLAIKRRMGLGPDSFRLAIFLLLVATLTVGAWAVQWRYVTVQAQDGGVLLRFNRFTGAQEIYVCKVSAEGRGSPWMYIAPHATCEWVKR